MNLIEDYLRREHHLNDLIDENDSPEIKLEYFFNLFVELEKKYLIKIEDMKRLELEHKAEINNLENYVYKVKKLTEERERFVMDFKEENEELKGRIKYLENELESVRKEYTGVLSRNNRSRVKSDVSSSDDELHEETIELLVLEGFGRIVEAPVHEKIATILADRARVIDELETLKHHYQQAGVNSSTPLDSMSTMSLNNNKNKNGTNAMSIAKSLEEFTSSGSFNNQIDKQRHLDKIDLLESECDILKSANSKLSTQIGEYRQKYEALNTQNCNNMNQIRDLNKEIEELKDKMSKMNKVPESLDPDEEFNKQHLIAKLNQDNIMLKEEMDKLYDEISSFEVENKQLKGDNKLKGDEINKLRKEIDDLNNELDELVQFKTNYDRLKQEHEKLSASIKLHDQLLNEKLTSPRLNISISSSNGSNLTPSSSFIKKSSPLTGGDEKSVNPQLELDWIRGENEKLLLDLEKAQNKLNDKINQYQHLKEQLEVKDEQMKEFIEKYEKQQTTSDDVLGLQRKILDLEHDLAKEKENNQLVIDKNEEQTRDLMKKNDQLWSQAMNLEQSNKEAMLIIQEQNKAIQTLERKIDEANEKLKTLEDEKLDIMRMRDKFESDLSELSKEYDASNQEYTRFKEEKLNEIEINQSEIQNLKQRIDDLSESLNHLEKVNQGLQVDLDSLNKEKSFILNQNETTQCKVLQDVLSWQEKYTEVNFQLNKTKKENEQYEQVVKEKSDMVTAMEKERAEMVILLKQEALEKKDALDKLKQLDSLMNKNTEKVEELNEKYHKAEIQKSRLEVKLKEYENTQLKYDQAINELNDKRATLSQVLEKNGQLDVQISNLEQQLNEAKQSIIISEGIINELNHYKTESGSKLDEAVRLKRDFDAEKSKREKAESKAEEIREEYKKVKSKLTKYMDENGELKQENVEIKNQLETIRSKFNLIADKSHTELEKNTELQDRLSETKKRLEIAEMKCSQYSQKFDLLLKKYESRKLKQKNKVERLWEYLQKERAKYKDLLTNAQVDMTNAKYMMEKDGAQNGKLTRQDSQARQQLLEEKSKLMNNLADKDSKLRELKRQMFQLQSRIKYLEDENDSLNNRVESTIKERNKLRRDLHSSFKAIAQSQTVGPTDILDSTGTSINPDRSPTTNGHNMIRSVSIDPLEKAFKSTNSLSMSYWNELNASSCWDINYNTGLVLGGGKQRSEHAMGKNVKSSFDLNTHNNGKNSGDYYKKDAHTAVSLANDLNMILATPRSFR